MVLVSLLQETISRIGWIFSALKKVFKKASKKIIKNNKEKKTLPFLLKKKKQQKRFQNMLEEKKKCLDRRLSTITTIFVQKKFKIIISKS